MCLFSQDNGIKVTLHEREVSPIMVFQKIENQCDLHFIYDEQNIDGLNQIVSIDCEEESLNTVLNAIKKQTYLQFRVYDKSIAVAIQKKRITISGFVTDSLTGDYLIGAVVSMLGSNEGATTNEQGYYSLNVVADDGIVKSRFLGYESQLKYINVKEDFNLNFKLIPQKTMLHEVLVSTTGLQDTINGNVNGLNTISVKDIASLPLTYSEPDFIKATNYLPGVSRINYGSTGYSVRGSSAGESMVYFDNCPIYNISHTLADLSVFNPDIVQSVSLYKNGIPAELGGGSSVLNITSRNGDINHFHLKGGLGLISSRLSIEGPVVKGKLSYLLSLRRSNLEWKEYYDETIKKYRFIDANAKFHYEKSDKHQFNLSFCFGEDRMKYHYDNATYENPEQGWTTIALSFSLLHRYNPKFIMNSSVNISAYYYQAYNNYSDDSLYNELSGTIYNFELSNKYSWLINKKHTIDFGCQFTFYDVFTEDDITNSDVQDEDETELMELKGFYNDKRKVSNVLNVNYGLRCSYVKGIANPIGTSDLYEYIENEDLKKLELEPRFALSYRKSERNIFKLSFNQTYQNMHQVSYLGFTNNSYFIWIASSTSNKPLNSHQISLGYYHNTQASEYSFSAETYFRESKNNVSYFTDSLTSNTTLSMQNKLVSSIGKSYGLELYGHLNKDKVSVNISYSLSRSLRRSDEVNNGNWYSSNYDRPHNIAFNMNYYFAPKFRFVLSWLYSTGMPSSVSYDNLMNGNIKYDINSINKYRLPDYHRLDLGLVYENRKYPHRFHSIWSLNLYNIYNRDNRYINEGMSQYSSSGYNNTTMFKDYGIMPAISYSFKF